MVFVVCGTQLSFMGFSQKYIQPGSLGSREYITSLFMGSSNFLIFTNNRFFNVTSHISTNFWAKYFLYTQLSLTLQIYHIVDGIQFAGNLGSWVLQFNGNYMQSDSRSQIISVGTGVHTVHYSISTIYKSLTWLERELSEFSAVNFLGLVDTRRLLLDYVESKQTPQTHLLVDKNFNNVYYDIFLNY